MDTTRLLVICLTVVSMAACASSVVPDYGDSGRRDAPVTITDAVLIDTADRVDVRPPMCADFQTLCNGRCVDTSTDPANCGRCGLTCMTGACGSGTCSTVCPMPQIVCNGRCVDVRTDATNCGGCGRVCPMGSTCSMGGCTGPCPGGLALCGGRCVDITRDDANCGGCGRACPSVVGGVGFCAGGMCRIECAPDRVQCGARCADVRSDPDNCGRCGLACPSRMCAGAMCRITGRPVPGAYPTAFAPLPVTGTGVVNADDTTTGLVPLGFSFRYFAATYTDVNISSNGFLGFDAAMTNGCCSGAPIPNNDPINNVIAAAWTDLFPPGAPAAPNAVTYATRGVAPNRIFVVSWTDLPWCCGASGPPRVSTQIVLHETTDQIEIFTTYQNAGHVYTQGAEDPTGTTAYFIRGRVAADYALMGDGVVIYTN